MYCPQKNGDCIGRKCMACSYNTYYHLKETPPNFPECRALPMVFELDIGFCKTYNESVDGGNLVRRLEKFLGLRQ